MTIEQELCKLTKVTRRTGEITQAYLKRLYRRASDKSVISDDDWETLSEDAQKWVNAASEANDDKVALPIFKDAVDEEEVDDGPSFDEEVEEKKVSSTKKKAAKAKAPAEESVKAAKKKVAAKAPKAKVKAAAPKPKAKAKAKAKANNGGGPRTGTKTAQVGTLLQRAKGCTRAEILEATGWPSVSVQQMAKLLGLKLTAEKEGEGRTLRYYGK